jgi:hypothetical protein
MADAGVSFAETSEICSEAERLLLLGAGDDIISSLGNGGDMSTIKAIRGASANMLAKFHGVSLDVQRYRSTLAQKKEQVEKVKETFLSVPVLEDYKRYVLAKRELEILECVRALLRLRAWRSTSDIPQLVLAVSVPDGLTRDMKASKLLVEVVGEVMAALLERYHQGFGSSFSDDNVEFAVPEGDEETEDARQQQMERQRRQWAAFIDETREWLVAYTLVALLPHTREDLRVVLERFQEALDTTLTPLWGRFSFHLLHARESRSVKQLLWTFAYARDFANMLDTLCATLTQGAGAGSRGGAPLARLIRGVRSGAGGANQSSSSSSGGYALAAKQYIVDKVCKFMRAHVAAVLAEWHPLADATLFQLVESSLELDHFLYAEILLPAQPLAVSATVRAGSETAHSGAAVRGSPVVPALGQSVAGLLYDVRELFLRWLSADLNHFQSILAAELGNERSAYEMRAFSFQLEPSSGVDGAASRFLVPGPRTVHHSCCSGVHLCCHLFVLACTRYRHLTKQAQIVAAKCVLEPLLCCVTTVLLYRVHSHPLLQLVMKARQQLDASAGAAAAARAREGGLLAAMGVRPQDAPLFRKAAVEISASAVFLQFFLRHAVGTATGGNDIASIVVSAEVAGSAQGLQGAGSSINIESYWTNCHSVIKAAARTPSLVVMDHPAADPDSIGGTSGAGSSALATTNNNFNARSFLELLGKVLRRNASVTAIAQVCAPMLLNCNNGNLYVSSSVEYACSQAQTMAAAMSV